MTPVLVVKNDVAPAVVTRNAMSELLVVGICAVVFVDAVVTDAVLGALVEKVDVTGFERVLVSKVWV